MGCRGFRGGLFHQAAGSLTGEACLWSECEARAQAEGRLGRGCARVLVLRALLLNSSPVAWRWQRPPGYGDRRWRWTEGCLDSFMCPQYCSPLVGACGILLMLVSLWFSSFPKTSQAAPRADCGPLSERTWLPRRHGRQQHSPGAPNPRIESGPGHRQRRGNHKAAAGTCTLSRGHHLSCRAGLGGLVIALRSPS